MTRCKMPTKKENGLNTLNSKAPTDIPPDAPDPASPMKWSLPILLAKMDAPTWKRSQNQK